MVRLWLACPQMRAGAARAWGSRCQALTSTHPMPPPPPLRSRAQAGAPRRGTRARTAGARHRRPAARVAGVPLRGRRCSGRARRRDRVQRPPLRRHAALPGVAPRRAGGRGDRAAAGQVPPRAAAGLAAPPAGARGGRGGRVARRRRLRRGQRRRRPQTVWRARVGAAAGCGGGSRGAIVSAGKEARGSWPVGAARARARAGAGARARARRGRTVLAHLSAGARHNAARSLRSPAQIAGDTAASCTSTAPAVETTRRRRRYAVPEVRRRPSRPPETSKLAQMGSSRPPQ
jgi:hypothetical protein